MCKCVLLCCWQNFISTCLMCVFCHVTDKISFLHKFNVWMCSVVSLTKLIFLHKFNMWVSSVVSLTKFHFYISLMWMRSVVSLTKFHFYANLMCQYFLLSLTKFHFYTSLMCECVLSCHWQYSPAPWHWQPLSALVLIFKSVSFDTWSKQPLYNPWSCL